MAYEQTCEVGAKIFLNRHEKTHQMNFCYINLAQNLKYHVGCVKFILNFPFDEADTKCKTQF